MPLNGLSLSEMIDLSEATFPAREVTFDEAVARLAEHLPPIAKHPEISDKLTDQGRELIARLQSPSIEAALDLTQSGEAGNALPEPLDAPPAVEGQAGGAPIPSAAESSAAGLPEPIPPAVSEPQDAPSPVASGAEEGGGGRVVAAPDTPTATVSGGV